MSAWAPLDPAGRQEAPVGVVVQLSFPEEGQTASEGANGTLQPLGSSSLHLEAVPAPPLGSDRVAGWLCPLLHSRNPLTSSAMSHRQEAAELHLILSGVCSAGPGDSDWDKAGLTAWH